MKHINTLLLSVTAILALTTNAFAYGDTYICSVKSGSQKWAKVLQLRDVAGCQSMNGRICPEGEEDEWSGMNQSGKVRVGPYEVSMAIGSDSLEGPDGRGHFIPVLSYKIEEKEHSDSGFGFLTGLTLKNTVVSQGEGFSISVGDVAVSCKQKN